MDYIRSLSQLLPLLSNASREQIEYVVSVKNLRKLSIQLVRQTASKQVVLSLLKLILKGYESYNSFV